MVRVAEDQEDHRLPVLHLLLVDGLPIAALLTEVEVPIIHLLKAVGERKPLHPFSSHWEDGDSPSGGRCQQLVHPPLHLPRNLNLDINTLCGYPIVKIEI